MKKIRTRAILGAVILVTLCTQLSITASENPKLVVGTFDSRAIVVAYVQSDEFREYLVAQQTDVANVLKRARATGDNALVAELDALGPAMQKRLHDQGFGTAPVDDIIARIEDTLPDIAREAGVDLIVSKWSLTYRNPAATFVDVTNLIAARFEPNERTLKIIQSTMETDPVPLTEIDHNH